jgi:hypothetical protein
VVTRASAARRVAFALAGASGVAAAVVIACGTGDISDLTAGRPDAGAADVAVDSAICIHAAPPPRPTTPDGPNTPSLVFAFESVRFDTTEDPDAGAPKPQGLDLDDTCTCPETNLEPESCIPPDAGGMKRACDGVDGRDNAAGPLLAGAATVGMGQGPAVFQEQIRAGAFNVIAIVSGWNGQPDDPSVIVGIQLSGGTEGSQGDAGRDRPKFDGTDVWTVTPDSVLGGSGLIGKDCRTVASTCIAVKADTMAYVSGGVLVAHLDLALPIITRNTSFTLEFAAATITARMTQDGPLKRVVGEIDGRWPIERLLPSLARLPNLVTQDGRPICEDGGIEVYRLIKKNACDSVDLTANPALDRTGARCDAISNAITFTAVTATVGTVVATPNEEPQCVGFTDSCESSK